MFKKSTKMLKRIEKIVKPWTNTLDECDGRNLNGVAITLTYANERDKEAPTAYYDYCEVVVQDVRWNGERKRSERDVYYVHHNGDVCKL